MEHEYLSLSGTLLSARNDLLFLMGRCMVSASAAHCEAEPLRHPQAVRFPCFHLSVATFLWSLCVRASACLCGCPSLCPCLSVHLLFQSPSVCGSISLSGCCLVATRLAVSLATCLRACVSLCLHMLSLFVCVSLSISLSLSRCLLSFSAFLMTPCDCVSLFVSTFLTVPRLCLSFSVTMFQ